MNKIFILLILFYTSVSYSQLFEGQKFCEESKDESYFPILIEKKKIFWKSTFYFETKSQTKVLNGKTYMEFKQEWKDLNVDLLYLREENGIIYNLINAVKMKPSGMIQNLKQVKHGHHQVKKWHIK